MVEHKGYFAALRPLKGYFAALQHQTGLLRRPWFAVLAFVGIHLVCRAALYNVRAPDRQKLPLVR